jgi:hypothetical protein
MNASPPGQHHLACIPRHGIVGAVIVAAALCAASVVAQNPQPDPPEAFGQVYHCKPGPWGDLEYYYIDLEPPDRVLHDMVFPDPAPKWRFPAGKAACVRKLFEKAALPAALQMYLLDPLHSAIEDDVLTVFPPLPDLLAMTAAQRIIIYSELGKSSLNSYYARPILITDNDPDMWLARAQWRPELREAAKKLIYRCGDTMCFSDVPALLAMTQSEKEVRAVVKTMWRTRSLVLQLNVKSQADFAEVARYWSGGDRNPDVESIILPDTSSAGPMRLDGVHLLPPLPRRFLYSYPSDELTMASQLPDCNWTALNFFNITPFDYHTDVQKLTQRLEEAYTTVDAPFAFGDVLLLFGPNDIFAHSCVYVADEIVYTKNGNGRMAPWILMKFADVARLYSNNQPLSIRGYRLKPQEAR